MEQCTTGTLGSFAQSPSQSPAAIVSPGDLPLLRVADRGAQRRRRRRLCLLLLRQRRRRSALAALLPLRRPLLLLLWRRLQMGGRLRCGLAVQAELREARQDALAVHTHVEALPRVLRVDDRLHPLPPPRHPVVAVLIRR